MLTIYRAVSVVKIEITFRSGDVKWVKCRDLRGGQYLNCGVGSDRVTVKAIPASAAQTMKFRQYVVDKYYLHGNEGQPTRTTSGWDEAYEWVDAAEGYWDTPVHGPLPGLEDPETRVQVNWELAENTSELRRRFEATVHLYDENKQELCTRDWGFDVKVKKVGQTRWGSDIVDVDTYDYWPKD